MATTLAMGDGTNVDDDPIVDDENDIANINDATNNNDNVPIESDTIELFSKKVAIALLGGEAVLQRVLDVRQWGYQIVHGGEMMYYPKNMTNAQIQDMVRKLG